MTIVRGREILRQLWVAVVHHDQQPLGDHRRGDPYMQGRSAFAAAVLNRILGKRLQQERRYVGAQRLGSGVYRDAETISEAGLLDSEVGLEAGALGGQI